MFTLLFVLGELMLLNSAFTLTPTFSNLSKALLVSFALKSFAWASPFEVLPKKIEAPADNPTTPEKVSLGSKLYHDARLSQDGTVSCASCHSIMTSGTDNRPTSAGIRGQVGGRNAPTVFNSALLSVQFWDGRANSLEDQAKGPLTNPIEMGMSDHNIVISRIKDIPGYVTEFEKVFGKNSIHIDNFAKAVAAYERTLITYNSPLDKYLAGNKSALTLEAIEGMKAFESTGCTACHNGPALAGPKLPIGVGFYQKFPTFPGSKYDAQYALSKDLGRFDVTKKEQDKNMFRVPTLRNIALTAPYFHNGEVGTLDEAVRVMGKTQLNKELSEKDVKSIVAFLNSLTGELPPQQMPVLPPTAGRTLIRKF
jgi:cytochrome c peroxidase